MSGTPIAPERKRFRKSSTPESMETHLSNNMANQELKSMLNEMFDSKLEPLYERFNSIEDCVKSYKVEIKLLQKKVLVSDEKIASLERELENLRKRQIGSESQSRRNNLKLYGIPESRGEIIEEKLDKFFYDSGLRVDSYILDRAHRLGPFRASQNQPRPIIMRFTRFRDRELVWQKANKRPSQNVYVQEDYPAEIENDQKRLIPVFHAIQSIRNQDGKPKYHTRISVDKLIVNNQVYTVANLEDLPHPIKPSKLFTPSNEEQVSFFSPNSPLSNMFPSPFTQDGDRFTCMEQFIVTKKAQLFGDQKVVVEVSKESNPFKQKQIGKKVENFDRAKWEADAPNLILPGLTAKFMQNEICKTTLLESADKRIVEANPYDNFFGAALSLRDKNIWIPDKVVGRNEMGKLLVRVRDLLK